MADNEQIGRSDLLNEVRKELDGKITALDPKIEKKVSYEVFFGVLALLVMIGGGVLWYSIEQSGTATNSVAGLTNRIVVLETKIEQEKKPGYR